MNPTELQQVVAFEEALLLGGGAGGVDSCGESDMEGLDLSLFEPQADANSWCDSRAHAGFLYLLVHYCGKMAYVYVQARSLLGD